MTRIAIVGAGRMGMRHVAAAARCPAVELVAVVEPAPSVSDDTLPPGVRLARGLEAVIDEVDAVVIAAPTALHDTIVESALAAGRHVLCEKPLTLDVARDTALAALADARGRVLQVGFWRRLAWPYAEAQRLLSDGTIGAPQLVRLAQWDGAPPPVSFCDPAVSGGIEIDMGIHEADLAAFILGEPLVAVAAAGGPATGAIADAGDVETVGAFGQTASGRCALIDLTRTAGYADDVRTEIVGSAGSLRIETLGVGAVLVGAGGRVERRAGPGADVFEDALEAQLVQFARGVANGRRAAGAAGPLDSSRALAVCAAMRQARRAGALVQIPS